MLVTRPVRRWLGRFFHLLPVRCHVTSPDIQMSALGHRRVWLETHIFIALVDHDETLVGVSYASHSVCDHFTSSSFTARFDKCGKPPIATFGFRSSSVVQHLDRPASA